MFDLTPFDKSSRRWLDRVDRDLRQLDRWMGGNFGEMMRTDIEDKGDHYELSAELPGFDKSEIKLQIHNDHLTINATHAEETQKEDKDRHFTSRERSYSNYQRSFNVSDIESDQIKAEFKNGVLLIKLPKKNVTEAEGEGPIDITIE